MGRSKNVQPKRRSDFTVHDESLSTSTSTSTSSPSVAPNDLQNDSMRIGTVAPSVPVVAQTDLETKTKKRKRKRRRLVRLSEREKDGTSSRQKEPGIELDSNTEKDIGNRLTTSTTMQQSLASSTAIPKQIPELTIIKSPLNNNNNTNGEDSFTIIQICSRHNNCSSTNKQNEPFKGDREDFYRQDVLRQYRLNQSRIELISSETNNNDQKVSGTTTYSATATIQSYDGALALIQHCVSVYNECDNNNNNNCQQEGIEDIAMAVQDNTICIDLDNIMSSSTEKDKKNVVNVYFRLTKQSYLLCSPTRLPLTSRIKRSKKYQPTIRFHRALASIFLPQSFLTEVLQNPISKPHERSKPITAKMVYDVMDNVKLKDYYERKQLLDDNETMKIKGLVPTLRPYQKAAVQWMLQREGKHDTGVSSNNETVQENRIIREWEMAWYVITTCDDFGDTNNDDGGEICAKAQAKLVPLPEWQNGALENDTNESSLLFFSPFAGWLAKTYEEARNYTIQDILPRWNPSIHLQPIVSGGILAESMGLGKTVEVLACILANPLKSKQPQKVAHGVLSSPQEKTSLKEGEREKQGDNDGDDIIVPSHTKSTEYREENIEIDDNSNRIVDCMHTLGECICGRSSKFSNCLPSVVCGKCCEPMHGICAGFNSEAEIISQTKVQAIFVDGVEIVCRVCSYKRCPCCMAGECGSLSNGEMNLIESRATLIVTPPAILDQWEREIRRHTAISENNNTNSVSYSIEVESRGTKPLKVVVYPGVRELSQSVGISGRHDGGEQQFSAKRPGIHLVHPEVLADADIVLMTFNALMQDLGHSTDNPFVAGSSGRGSVGRNLRSRKRYRVIPSPLSSIKFWRVCLDEAQRVEAPTAASAKMALKLQCQHRWCVSGTPIGKGRLEDLYGLLLFLGVVPYCSREWFASSLCHSHPDVMERVKQLLQTIFWRSTKASSRVREQMGIPEQVERKVILHFSSIERHFYDRQRKETMLAASKVVGMDVNKRKSSQTAVLASQLHKLRAACCHPQVGSHGIGQINRRGYNVRNDNADGYNAVGIGTRVLSMEQILHRLIDDARTKCEEAQRFAVMHTNALACLAKLKIDAKSRGIHVTDSDESLLIRSCKEYMESLALTEKNAKPTLVLGEANLSGCVGFRSSKKIMKDGSALLDWQMKVHQDSPSQLSSKFREVWSRIEFEGPSKRLVGVKVRPLCSIPSDVSGEVWRLLEPKDCILQVSNSSVGGEFVDVAAFTLPQKSTNVRHENDWTIFDGLRTNKSKSWRLVVKNYHPCNPSIAVAAQSSSVQAYIVGVEIQLLESDIAVDNLQRLHTLHNTALALISLQQLRQTSADKTNNIDLVIAGKSVDISSNDCIEEKITCMQAECAKLEALYVDTARTVHKESQRQLHEASTKRKQYETDLTKMTKRVRPNNKTGGVESEITFWADAWWDDLLSTCFLRGSPPERVSLCDTVGEEINDFYTDTVAGQSSRKRFPSFRDVDGLRVALGVYIDEVGASANSHASRMQSVRKLSSYPTAAEISENNHCGKCRADWHQTGPTCSHCKLDKALEKLENDPLLILVLSAMSRWIKDLRPSNSFGLALAAARVCDRASKFLDILKFSERERLVARVAWRTHFDLLSDIDELNQCKQTMRLAQESENLMKLSEEELNFIVAPWDIATKVMEHEAKQAMSLADLRRSKDTLRYLKNQNVDQQKKTGAGSKEGHEDDSANCMICLSAFRGERAVLRCGHSFHYSPCLENLMKRSGNKQIINCPLRCTVQTKPEEVMIASNKRKDDGSKTGRTIKGSWGTKVTRLIGDVMDVSDLGEKSIVFSQWEDMLEVVEQALVVNTIKYVRAKSLARIGEALKKFRSNECTVLLLNVKNGAEGLTLVEATHVFMVEPLLNCGLDSQAINRIHRIGQTCKTFVHRYLIEDTIEVKIDKMRVDRQEDQLEDAIQNTKKKHDFSAGGIDGGFSTEELEEVLKENF